MAGRVTATVCPNCGGPLDPAVLNKSADPTCPHCHVAAPITEDPTPAFVISGVGSALRYIPPTASSRSGRRSGWIGLVVVLAIVGVVAAIVAFSVKNSGTFAAASKYSTAQSTVVPVGSSARPADFYVIAPSIPGVENEILRRVDPLTDKILWSSPTLDQEEAGFPTVVAGPTQAFAIFGATVAAFDATSGHPLWRASLSNGLAFPCDSGCALVVGQELVTLAKDGTVQALNVATGAQTWSHHLNSTPRWLESAGTSVLVPDTVASGSDLGVVVYDAASGSVHTIAPTCAPDPDDGNVGAPDEANQFFVSPDGSSLTALIATIDGCVARYRLSDGAMFWRSPTEPFSMEIPATLTGESTAQSQSTLAWTNNGAVYAVDTSSGAIRKVSDAAKNSEFDLIGINGTTLVATSAPNFDSNKPATVAIDLATGMARWQVASRVVKSGDTQMVVATGANPVIISCNDDADTCLFEAVDLQTGTIKGSSTVSADPGSVDEVKVTVTATSVAAVVGWSHIVGFDPTSAAVQWRWPS